MKIKCNTLLEAPLMTLLRQYHSLHVKGVCGIFTEGSAHNVEGTSLGSLALLSYCNDLEVVSSEINKLLIVDITIEKGPITYSKIAERSKGHLALPEGLEDNSFGMATSDMHFKLLLGKTTSESPLEDSYVFSYVAAANLSDWHFTAVPLPLLHKKPLNFSVERENGMSTIFSPNADTELYTNMISSIKIF